MKYIIASDIHGSSYYTKKLVDIYNSESCNKLILLGDILNHGPRNPFPKEYDPIKVSELLLTIKDIMWIKGNCDSEVDEMVFGFKAINEGMIVLNNVNFYLSHGHITNKDNNNLSSGDYLVTGHTHIPVCEVIDGITYLNPGSISIPKSDDDCCYIIIDDNNLVCKNFDGKVIYEVKYA